MKTIFIDCCMVGITKKQQNGYQKYLDNMVFTSSENYIIDIQDWLYENNEEHEIFCNEELTQEEIDSLECICALDGIDAKTDIKEAMDNDEEAYDYYDY